MSDLLVNLLLIYLLILIGYILGKLTKKYNSQIRLALSFAVLYILTPILIFLSFFTSNIVFGIAEITSFVMLRLIVCFIPQLFVFMIFLKKRPVEENGRKGSIISQSGFANNVLFPLPIVLVLFGTEFVPILITFSITALVLRGTWLTWLCIRYGGKGEEDYGIKKTIKQILTFPPTLTILLCLILLPFNLQFDQGVIVPLNDITSIIISIFGNILIGFMLVNVNFKMIREFKNDFALVTFVRVGFCALLFLPISLFLYYPPEIRTSTLTILFILFSGPPAILNTTFAEYFDMDKEFTAFCVVTITIFALIYTPLFILLGLAIF